MNAALPVTPHRLVVAPAVNDFLAVQRFRDWLPAHRVHWFNALSDADQLRMARGYENMAEGKR